MEAWMVLKRRFDEGKSVEPAAVCSTAECQAAQKLLGLSQRSENHVRH